VESTNKGRAFGVWFDGWFALLVVERFSISLTTVRLRQAWNWGSLTFKELEIRTYRQMDAHETLDRAAAVAFYAMLSLPPFLGPLLASLVGGSGRLGEQLQVLARQSLPTEVAAIIENQVAEIQTTSPTGLLSLATVLLLWSAFGAFIGVMGDPPCGLALAVPHLRPRHPLAGLPPPPAVDAQTRSLSEVLSGLGP
jgi:hypothetical protein